jgi:hypothetical protein
MLVLGIGLIAAGSASADSWQPLEQWRIESGSVAPWAKAGTRIDPAYRGGEVRFQRSRVTAPAPLACEGAKYEWLFVGATDLFEGNLPAPAATAAQKLGLGPGPIATLRVSCTNAGFDFHRTSGGTLLLGLDNVVWTLRAARPASTPAEVVQELLVAHFTHGMGFTADSVARKRDFLSAALRSRIARYMARPKSADTVPDINGDPFTDSQEYPDRFTLGATQVSSQEAVVPVNFADAHSKRRLDYVLVQESTSWVVDDIRHARGQSLRTLLGANPVTGGALAMRVAARTESFDAFFARFRAALATGRGADVAALVHVPFLYEGRQLDTAGVTRIVPTLFPAAVKRCLASAKAIPEDDRQVVFCKPYAFYFGREAGSYRLLEFGADGEDVP